MQKAYYPFYVKMQKLKIVKVPNCGTSNHCTEHRPSLYLRGRLALHFKEDIKLAIRVTRSSRAVVVLLPAKLIKKVI